MACKYKFWDKTEDIYVQSGQKFTASEYLQKYAWAARDDAKVVISNGPINGSCFYEFSNFLQEKEQLGFAPKYGMTDEQILQAISDFEDNQNSYYNDIASNQIKVNEAWAQYFREMNVVNSQMISRLESMHKIIEEDPFA